MGVSVRIRRSLRGSPLNRWWVKAAAQGALAALPGAGHLDDRLRRWLAPPRLTESYALSKWHHVEQHLKAMGRRPGESLAGVEVVELGTGWFPLVPLGLALHGANVLTLDKSTHLDAHQVRLTLRMLHDLVAAGTISAGDPERVARLHEVVSDPTERTAGELLAPLGVRPRIADARDLSTVPGAPGADLLVSNNTLEHIPPAVLRDIFAAFHRVTSHGARMSHYIDLADHYAGFDPRISEFHFLTLTPWQWRLANNDLAYQNRLRIRAYRQLMRETGWLVTGQQLTTRRARRLEGLDLVPPYDQMTSEDLVVVKAHLVADRWG